MAINLLPLPRRTETAAVVINQEANEMMENRYLRGLPGKVQAGLRAALFCRLPAQTRPFWFQQLCQRVWGAGPGVVYPFHQH